MEMRHQLKERLCRSLPGDDELANGQFVKVNPEGSPMRIEADRPRTIHNEGHAS